jgi:protein tyrosine/serine phosphatase
LPVPPDAPAHSAGVHRFTVWSTPDGFVKVMVWPAAIVVAAGEKQNVEQPGPPVPTVTVAVDAARARANGLRVVVVVTADVVVGRKSVVVVVAGVEVVEVSGTTRVVVVAGAVVETADSAVAGSDTSASRTRASAATAVVRRMIELPGVASTVPGWASTAPAGCDTDDGKHRFDWQGGRIQRLCTRCSTAGKPAAARGLYRAISMRIEPHSRPRRIALERAFNFRDLGGYAAGSGQTVRWGRVYRADGIHRVEGADLVRVAALGIRTVLDLRTRDERDGHGRVRAESMNATYHHLPLIEKVWERDLYRAELDAVAFLADRYVAMLEQGADAIVTALSTVADAERLPLVFHCSAGKDRTGVLAAVILSVLGVSDDDIAADYALSRTAMREMAEWMRNERPESYETMAAQPPAFLDAPPLAIRHFLARARARYGSLAEYVVAAGFPPDGVDALRAGLLA